MNVNYKTLNFNLSHITFIGKNPENFDKPNANWFNIRILYKTMEHNIPNYKKGYLKAYVEFLRISDDKKSFVYSNKEDAVLNIYDIDSKQILKVSARDVEIDNFTR